MSILEKSLDKFEFIIIKKHDKTVLNISLIGMAKYSKNFSRHLHCIIIILKCATIFDITLKPISVDRQGIDVICIFLSFTEVVGSLAQSNYSSFNILVIDTFFIFIIFSLIAKFIKIIFITIFVLVENDGHA